MNVFWSPRQQQCHFENVWAVAKVKLDPDKSGYYSEERVGAEEALSKGSCSLSCLGRPLRLFMHVQWDAGGMEGHSSQNSSQRKETYSCAPEMKLQLKREEKCSEKWEQVASSQKLIGTTANFIH